MTREEINRELAVAAREDAAEQGELIEPPHDVEDVMESGDSADMIAWPEDLSSFVIPDWMDVEDIPIAKLLSMPFRKQDSETRFLIANRLREEYLQVHGDLARLRAQEERLTMQNVDLSDLYAFYDLLGKTAADCARKGGLDWLQAADLIHLRQRQFKVVLRSLQIAVDASAAAAKPDPSKMDVEALEAELNAAKAQGVEWLPYRSTGGISGEVYHWVLLLVDGERIMQCSHSTRTYPRRAAVRAVREHLGETQ